MGSVRECVPQHTVAANLLALALGQKLFGSPLRSILFAEGGKKVALIKSFKALRPVPQYAHQVAALPYDVVSGEEARELVRDNPFSFLHVAERRSTWILLWTLTTGKFTPEPLPIYAGWCRKECSGRMRKIVFISTA